MYYNSKHVSKQADRWDEKKKKKNTAQSHTKKIDADKAKGIDLCYLCEGPGSALDAELCVAELAEAGV